MDKRKDIVDTTAGRTIIRKFNEKMKQCKAELREAREKMVRALVEKDERTRRELEEVTRRLQKLIVEIAKYEKGMSADYAAEKEMVEVRLKEMVQEAQKREGDEASRIQSSK